MIVPFSDRCDQLLSLRVFSLGLLRMGDRWSGVSPEVEDVLLISVVFAVSS